VGNTNIDPDTMPASRRNSKRGQLEHILDQLSAEELRLFVLKTALQDKALYETLMVNFSELLSSNEPKESIYQERLLKITAQYTNQDGYISRKNAYGLNSAITALLHTARKATTPPRESIDLCTATISILPELGDKMDDVDEHLYPLMQLVCTILSECFESLKPEAQEACFQRILAIYAEPDFLDLDLDSYLLAVLKEWAKDNKQRQANCLRQQELMLKASEEDQWKKNYLLQQTNDLLAYWRNE